MTIKDIAKNLNVSYSTVSLSLNNDPRVAEKTKKRVIEEAERLGFTFNANARSLVTKKTNRIGIVFSDNFNAPDYRWFFNEIETYSTRAVENCGYDFLIQPNKNIHSQSNILRMVNGKMVDGLVIFSKTLTEAEYKFLSDAGIPYVYVYFKPSFSADIPDHFFWDDNRKGGYWATKHLLEHGHRKMEAQAKELRSALETAEEANRAKSDFLSRMSHDIRTPLNAVLGMKDIAEAHLDDPAKVKDCLRKIGLSGQHLLSLINDVLDMSKIESGEMLLREDSMSLPEVLENVVAIMQPQFGEKEQHFSIRLRSVVHEQFLSDALRMRQIFINILSNAYKFTPVNGTVSMDVCEKQAVDGTALFSFSITDTGIGMKPEYLAQIFTAFSRERDSRVDKTEGTGLGMAITKRFVDMMGGTIEVTSELGKGTCFRVELPLKIEENQFIKGEFPGLRIIVTDDDAVMCEYMAEMLGQLGIHADWVDSGIQTVEMIKTAKQNGEMYDAVLLDWKMPDLDGFETTRRIRELCGGQLPVLIISAYDWSDVEKDAKKAGVTGFLQKPIFVSTLIHGLQRYVLEGQPARKTQGTDTGARFTGRRFLLIEDNAINQEVARELLADMGAEVDTASDGAEGVETFRRSPDGFYDVILMDVQMPVMNGYEATRAIRTMDRDGAKAVPILAMTADAFSEDIQAAKDAGMNGHMAKPLDKAILWREIGKYLNSDFSPETAGKSGVNH